MNSSFLNGFFLFRNDEMQEQMKRTSERKIEKDRLNEIQDDDLSSADFSRFNLDPYYNRNYF